MNPKAKGEKGVAIVIGELAKWDIAVALPMSDNLPFDIIVIRQRLLKAQVKTSTQAPNNGAILFDLTSNNWYSKKTKKYTKQDCDAMILTDYKSVYLLAPEQFVGRKAFSIRQEVSKNNQQKGINLHDDFVLSERRIREVLGD